MNDLLSVEPLLDGERQVLVPVLDARLPRAA
jgi:hypothetical protein